MNVLFILVITFIYLLSIFVIDSHYRKKKSTQGEENATKKSDENIKCETSVPNIINIVYDMQDDINEYKSQLADMSFNRTVLFSEKINQKATFTDTEKTNTIKPDFTNINFTKLKTINL